MNSSQQLGLGYTVSKSLQTKCSRLVSYITLILSKLTNVNVYLGYSIVKCTTRKQGKNTDAS